MVRVARIRLDGGYDGLRRNEAADVVHMAVRVVARHAASQPDHLIDAEKIVKGPLKLLTAHAGVALLHVAQQALLSSEQNSLAIRVDRSAFQHQAAPRAIFKLDFRLP